MNQSYLDQIKTLQNKTDKATRQADEDRKMNVDLKSKVEVLEMVIQKYQQKEEAQEQLYEQIKVDNPEFFQKTSKLNQ